MGMLDAESIYLRIVDQVTAMFWDNGLSELQGIRPG
jgi:hypothetical protein